MSNAFLGFPLNLKNQIAPYELHTQALANHASMCGIMWQTKLVSCVFHQPAQ